MRRSTLLALPSLALGTCLVLAPAALAAQGPNPTGVYREEIALRNLSETRRIMLLPNETVGFRVLGATNEARVLRVSTGHLVEGRLYSAVAVVTPRDGGAVRRTEGTISVDAPVLNLGTLPDGEYLITMHLEDLSSGSTRDARNKVVLY